MLFGVNQQRTLMGKRNPLARSAPKRSLFKALILSLAIVGTLQSTGSHANCVTPLRELLAASHKIASGTQKRSLKQIPELRFGTYNAYNLMGSADGKVAKAESKRVGVASVILDNNLDVVVLQEVENEAALKQFASQYLNDLYEPLMSRGNDQRGIQIAYLVKKDLPFQIELLSHAKSTATYPVTGNVQPIFSRDLPALKIWSESQDSKTEDPLVSFFGTHFKSKRDRGGDPESRILRGAQVQAASEIIETEMQMHPKSFVMIAGDFNGDVRLEKEFDPLKRVLKDAFDMQSRQMSDEERVTHTFHPRGGATHYSQIDAFLVKDSDPALIKEARVYRYKDAAGQEKPIPDTYNAREENPSDHFPVLFNLDFQKLLNDRNLMPQASNLRLHSFEDELAA